MNLGQFVLKTNPADTDFVVGYQPAGAGAAVETRTPIANIKAMVIGALTAADIPALTSAKITDFGAAVTAATSATLQPLDADLTAIAALTTLGYGRGMLETATAAAARTYLALGSAATLTAGAASGVATLDGGGKIPTSQIPDSVIGQVRYQGAWNASTNSPTLSASPGAASLGMYYVASVSGTQFSLSFEVGDWIVSNGAIWQKIDNTDAVTTVAGRIGAITLTTADIGGLGTLATQSGTFSGTSSGTNTGDQTITLTGEATGTGTGSFATTLTNSAVIGKVLTGYVSGAGTVAATDTILAAIQKIDGNDATKQPLDAALTALAAGSDFVQFTGPTTSTKVFTLPNASATVATLGQSQTFTGINTLTPAARSSGVASYFTLNAPSDTNQTLSTESIGANFAGSTRQWATGALALQRERVFGATTISFVGASTATTAINVDIADPVAGTNATITNIFGLRVNRVQATGQIVSTVSTGTAPLVVASTTNIPNLNASSLNGATFANPGAIGTTPGTGNFTAITGSGLLQVGAAGRFTGNSLTGATGAALEVMHNGTVGTVASYNRTGSAYTALNIDALSTNLQISGANIAAVTSTGLAVTGTNLSVTAPTGTDAAIVAQATYVVSTNRQASMRIRGAVQGGNYSSYLYFDNDYVGNTASHFIGAYATGLNFSLAGTAVAALATNSFQLGTNRGNTSTSAQLRIAYDSSAEQGINIQSVNASTSGNLIYFNANGGTNSGGIAYTGGQVGVVLNSSSDRRLKTNIRDFTNSGAIIDGLRPRMYDWLSGAQGHVGFVAQEEAAVDPLLERIGAVTTGDSDDETIITKQWQRSDAALVPILVAELKSLRARVAELEARNP